MPQVPPLEPQSELETEEEPLLPLDGEAKADSLRLTCTPPQRGQTTFMLPDVPRINFSKESPQSGQSYSKIGIALI